MSELREKLTKKVPYKWKIQTVSDNKPKARCVAYLDARDVMEVLDDAVGVGGWQDKYRRDDDGSLVCSIGIRVDDEWVWKEDVGTKSTYEKEKGEYSDAFKRAAVKWGVGRFLYDLKMEYVDTNKAGKGAYPVYPHNKERIWDLTEYINSKKKHGKK